MAAPLDLPGLILVTGSGPGTGKSSISDALFRQLRLAGKPVQWIYESDPRTHGESEVQWPPSDQATH